MPGTMLGARGIAVNKTDTASALIELTLKYGAKAIITGRDKCYGNQSRVRNISM